MIRRIQLSRSLITFGIPIILFGILVLLIKSSLPNGNSSLNLAITIDLLLTIPIIYFLLIRKSQIPNTTAIPIMVIGLLIGSYFLPKESQAYLNLFKNWVLPFVELFILFYVIFKVRKAIKTYKNLRSTSLDFYDTLKNVCFEILPKKLALPFATEVAVIYYGFINWKTRRLKSNEYFYHKKSGTPALLGGFIMIIVIETIALHFLIALWEWYYSLDINRIKLIYFGASFRVCQINVKKAHYHYAKNTIVTVWNNE